MKKILFSKKTLATAGGILLAAALIMGATYAWFSSETNPIGGEMGYFEIETAGFEFDEIAPDVAYTIQPGMDFVEPDGYIRNTGSISAFVEIGGLDITITRDADGKPLAPVDYYDAESNPATAGIVVAGFSIDATDPENAWYVNSGFAEPDPDDAFDPLRYGTIFHWVLPAKNGNSERHFLDIQASGTYNVYDLDTGDKIGEIVRDNVGVKVSTFIDMRTNARLMGKEWGGAILNGFGIKATQGMYEDAIKDELGLTDEDLWDPDLGLQWVVPDTGIYPLSLGAPAYVTPQDILRAQFDAAK
ncbi:MAG: hypothetical protein LBL49_02460 [Clostridiales Family XIII bacterium]|jgi:hypothetical protein|nr:hypothetical protein [Clostridiales Family XIII bacterium]